MNVAFGRKKTGLGLNCLLCLMYYLGVQTSSMMLSNSFCISSFISSIFSEGTERSAISSSNSSSKFSSSSLSSPLSFPGCLSPVDFSSLLSAWFSAFCNKKICISESLFFAPHKKQGNGENEMWGKS